MAKKIVQKPTPAEYGDFVRGLDLRDVLLVESSAKRFFLPLAGAVLNYEVKALKPTCEQYVNGFTIRATYTIDLIQQSESEGTESVREKFGMFRVSFDLIYASEQLLTDGHFEVFKQVNLPVNVWPYVRQHVHQQSILMGIPALILPVHRTGL